MDQSEPTILVQAIGDIAFFRTLQESYFRLGVSPFAPALSTLKQADVLVADFEFAFSREAKPGTAESNDSYRVRPEAIGMLSATKIDVCSLANNHILDWGLEGIRTTQDLLSGMGIQTLGAGADCSEARRPVVLERGGIWLGFLAYAKPSDCSCTEQQPGAAALRAEEVIRDIAALKPQVDHIILLLHWGIEFCDYPYPDDVNLGRTFIDKGASVVLGCHAHVIQGIERYRHGVIYYGLGNFIYDPHGEQIFVDAKLRERRECIIAKVWLTRSQVVGFDFIPCWIRDDGCTVVLEGEAEQALRQRVHTISAQIGNPGAVYATAVGNLLKRELQTYWFYLRRDGLCFIWRVLRDFKWRHVKLVVGYCASWMLRRG